jgi:NDP-sugar pyrophosphorylase family protein
MGLATQHEHLRARATLAVVEGDVARYGGVLVDARGRVSGFGRERHGTRALHFIGVQAVDAGVFAALPDNEPSETIGMLYPRLLSQEPDAVQVYESGAEFLDVGTARDYLTTVATVAGREGRPYDIGHDCVIAQDAAIERTILWDRVTIGPGAHLTDCIVADDVTVPAGAHYDNVVLTSRGAELLVSHL